MKFKLGIVAVLLVGILAAGVFAFGGFKHNPQADAALAADDYNAYAAALNNSHVPTQARFEKMATRYKPAKRNAMQKAQDAVKNNDFNAWKTALSSIVDSTTLTQTRFDAQVQSYQARQKIQQAISSNDFTAWKQAMTDELNARLTQENFNKLVNATNSNHFGHGPRFGMMRMH